LTASRAQVSGLAPQRHLHKHLRPRARREQGLSRDLTCTKGVTPYLECGANSGYGLHEGGIAEESNPLQRHQQSVTRSTIHCIFQRVNDVVHKTACNAGAQEERNEPRAKHKHSGQKRPEDIRPPCIIGGRAHMTTTRVFLFRNYQFWKYSIQHCSLMANIIGNVNA